MYIISGMHRSGTSLVARLFFEAGADLGDASTLYRADKWNPDGYFEQPQIHQLNMRLINGPWGKLAYFRLPSTATIMDRGHRVCTEIERLASQYQDKVVKETRFCLTLPAWRAHGATVRRILVCLRDPAAVADSLRRRNWITRAHAYRLWREHYRQLIAHAAESEIWFIHYRDVLDEKTFYREVQHAFQFMKMEVDERRMKQLQQSVVKRSLDHSAGGEADCPVEVQRLWRELLDRHSHQFSNYSTRAESELAS